MGSNVPIMYGICTSWPLLVANGTVAVPCSNIHGMQHSRELCSSSSFGRRWTFRVKSSLDAVLTFTNKDIPSFASGRLQVGEWGADQRAGWQTRGATTKATSDLSQLIRLRAYTGCVWPSCRPLHVEDSTPNPEQQRPGPDMGQRPDGMRGHVGDGNGPAVNTNKTSGSKRCSNMVLGPALVFFRPRLAGFLKTRSRCYIGGCITPMLLVWSWPGLCACINWQRHAPAHQDGSHFEPHLPLAMRLRPFPSFRSSSPSFSLLHLSDLGIFAISCPAFSFPSPQ